MRDEQALALSADKSDWAYRMCRRAIWLYLVLLIFEGALRKWFLPSFSDNTDRFLSRYMVENPFF